MATIDGLTKARLLQLEADTVIGAHLTGDNLILEQHDGSEINVGSVRGPEGTPGITDMALYDPIGVPKPLLILPIPGGHGVCDGTTEYLAADAPVLAAAFGTGPACVNGPAAVGNIKLPDLRGKTIFGFHAGITAFDTLMETGGSKDAVAVTHGHTATQAQHDHAGSDVHGGNAEHQHGTMDGGAHDHSVDGGDFGDRIVVSYGDAASQDLSSSGGFDVMYTSIDAAPNHNHGPTDWASGAAFHDHGITIDPDTPAITVDDYVNSGADKNLPPYRVANWIMRLG